MPKFEHSGVVFDIPAQWWVDTGMVGFKPSERWYRPGPSEPGFSLEEGPILILRIGDVAPPEVDLDSSGMLRGTTEVLRLLRSIRRGDAIPPIQVVKLRPGTTHTHRILHGAHRFYCSVGAGFSHVPAIEVKALLPETRGPLDAQ
jgi:hypothetical protein